MLRFIHRRRNVFEGGGGGQTPGVGNVNLLILKYHLSQIVLVEFRPDNKLMPMVSKDIYEEKKNPKIDNFHELVQS